MLVFRTALAYGLVSKRPRQRTDLGGRSYCDNCGRQLSWYENIPILSWIFLQGKSKCCRKNLSPLYPIVEFGLGILFAAWWQLYLTKNVSAPLLLIGCLVLLFLMFSAVFDLKYMILPDFSTVILFFLALILLFFDKGFDQIIWFLAAAMYGFCFIGFLYWITKGRGMGFGDVKFAGFMGLFLGIQGIVLAMYVAFISGALFGLGLMIFTRAGRKTKMAFGPFLIFGTLVAWWYAKLR